MLWNDVETFVLKKLKNAALDWGSWLVPENGKHLLGKKDQQALSLKWLYITRGIIFQSGPEEQYLAVQIPKYLFKCNCCLTISINAGHSRNN